MTQTEPDQMLKETTPLDQKLAVNERSKSVAVAANGDKKLMRDNSDIELNVQLLEKLKKKNRVLERSKESLFVKNSHTISRQEKKITKISKDLEQRDMVIVEKDKEIKLY